MSTHFSEFSSIASNFELLSIDNDSQWATTSCLTPELLGYIIYLASAGSNSNKESLHYLGATALRTSHVNRRWREVTLACKHIWQGPVLSWSMYSSSFEFIKTIIRRSSPLLLDIVIPGEMAPEIYPDVMEEVCKRERTRSLHVHLSPELVSGITRQTRYRPMARLPNRRGISQNNRALHRPPLVPVNAQYLPQQPHKASSVFPSLQLLTPSQECFAPIAILVDCIRDSVTLEVLRITGQPQDEFNEFDDPVYLPEAPQLTPSCALKNLKELSIAAPIHTCASLFKNIDIKPTCAVALTCYNASNDRLNTYPEILFKLEQSMKPWRCETDYEGSGRQTLYVSANHVGFLLEGPPSHFLDFLDSAEEFIHPNLSLILDWRQSSSPLDDLAILLARMLRIFSPRRHWPTTFSVEADNTIPITRVVRNPIVEWLGTHQDFQGFEFRTFDAFVLLEPLFRLRNAHHAITNGVVPCLSDLTFYEIVYTPLLLKTWRRLIRGLHRRKNLWSKNALTQVEFVNCATQAKEMGMEVMWNTIIEMLCPLVDEIIVDGDEYDFKIGQVDDDMGYDTDSTVHQDSDIEL